MAGNVNLYSKTFFFFFFFFLDEGVLVTPFPRPQPSHWPVLLPLELPLRSPLGIPPVGLLVGWPTLPPSLLSNLRCRHRRTHLCPPSSSNRVFFSSSLDADISSASLSIHCMPPPWPIQVSAPILALMSSMSPTSGPSGRMVLLWHAPVVHAAVVYLMALIGSPHCLNSKFAFYTHSEHYLNITTHFRILFHIFAAYFASSQLIRTSEAHFRNFGPISDLRSLFRKLRIYFGPPKFISETSHL
jgi:hypothetical protein